MAHAHDQEGEPDRRDVLYLATGVVGAVGVASAIWPLIDQMNPSASVLALSTIEEDISALEPGQQMVVTFLGSPVFVRRMSDADIESARNVDIGSLPDGDARNPNISDADASLENRLVDPNRDIIVMNGVCTHLGCVPVGDGAGDFGGWFCPCHGSHYDSAGRIRKGPAPENLPVPVASLDGDILKLG